MTEQELRDYADKKARKIFDGCVEEDAFFNQTLAIQVRCSDCSLHQETIRVKDVEIEVLKDMLAYEQTYVESIESRLKTAENLLHNYTVIDCCDTWETTIRTREFLKQKESYCKDCGTETKRGKGSARCPSCWEGRCGYSTTEGDG